MADTEVVRLKSIPIDGVECLIVDGTISRITLPGGIEISAPYSSLTVTGPKPVELKPAKSAVDALLDPVPF